MTELYVCSACKPAGGQGCGEQVQALHVFCCVCDGINEKDPFFVVSDACAMEMALVRGPIEGFAHYLTGRVHDLCEGDYCGGRWVSDAAIAEAERLLRLREESLAS